ncbi:MAG: hypothetical protein HY554_05695, partial [Elusimicrobia bacterium]|nr:hypothetical protein [Elusimicrobiota bacterium]
MAKSVSMKNLFVAALAGLLCGTIGEALLFLEAQVRRVEAVLAEDFRVVAFLGEELPEAKWKVVEEKLRALPGTSAIAFISRDSALESLRLQDPELAGSVALLGENPLQSSFEIALAPEAVSRAPAWAESASQIAGLGDIRFKPMQVRAVVQCQFYDRFLRLAISLAAFFWLAAAAAALWAAVTFREAQGALEALPPRLGMASVGTACGMGLVLIAALPLRSAPAAWAAPGAAAHACLFLAGALGALFAWDWSRPVRDLPGRVKT